MVGKFNEHAQSVWDFTRCQRPDGSYYGTGGKCRKGREAGKRELKLLGAGKESKVYDIGNGKVLKLGPESTGLNAHKKASELGLAPTLYRAGSKNGEHYQIMDRIDTSDIIGLPHPGTSNSDGKPLDELDERQLTRERDTYLAALDLNKNGVEHGDLHGGNMKWDNVKDRPVIIDFDNGKLDSRGAAKEASELLTTIGGRLESIDRYDEADELYAISKKLKKKPTPKLFEEASDLISDFFPTSPDEL